MDYTKHPNNELRISEYTIQAGIWYGVVISKIQNLTKTFIRHYKL